MGVGEVTIRSETVVTLCLTALALAFLAVMLRACEMDHERSMRKLPPAPTATVKP